MRSASLDCSPDRGCLYPDRRHPIGTLAQLVKINFRVPNFGGLQQVIPSNFMPRISGCSCQHTSERRFNALGRLIMKVSAGNAIDERFFLGGVCKFEIVAELARDRKGLGFARFWSGGF